jgi:putative ABC transport system permease protein
MPPPPNSELAYIAYVRVTGLALAGAFAVGFTATILAACIPAWRVSVIQVAEALRQSQ